MGKIRKHISPLQGQLHFPDKQARAALLTAEHGGERIVLRIILACIALSAALYVYFVASSTLNVIARNSAQGQAAQLESAVGALETRALALAKEITPERALALGLVQVKDTAYVHAQSDAALAGAPHNAI